MTSDELREVEAASIRAFVEACSEHFTGRVLDLGCGRSPYRGVIERAGGEYIGFDSADLPAYVGGADVSSNPLYSTESFDAILCTQVIQYVPVYDGREDHARVVAPLADLIDTCAHRLRKAHGVLVMTGPTNWPVVEPEDLWRFTPAGVARLLDDAGFSDHTVTSRAEVEFGPGLVMPLGWQAVAHA